MAEVQTQNLAAFLLARYDEEADSVSAYYGGRPPVVTGLEDADPARVLADIEAKRRIVAWCAPRQHVAPGTESASTTARFVMLALAQPFAEHEDFRPEWKQ